VPFFDKFDTSNKLMANIKKTTNWVYVKCSKCGKKRDLSIKDYEKKLLEFGNDDKLVENILCSKCKKVNNITNNIAKKVKEFVEVKEENIPEEPIYELEDKLFSK